MYDNKQYDVIIIGGSYAGLSAALALGRARRNVLLIDSGKPCNRSAPHSHNFLTHDGSVPAEISKVGKQQVMAYPTIDFLDDVVVSADGSDQNFAVTTSSGLKASARKLLFATGVKDLLPAINGFSESWGKSIIHCPYCHGYEFKDLPTGIMANGEIAFHFGRLIRNWTNKLTIFTNGACTLLKEQLAELDKLGVKVIETPIQSFQHDDGYISKVVLENGTAYAIDAMYAKLPFEQHCTAISEIGCALNEDGLVKVDDFLKTSIPGIYAAGDSTTLFRAVAGAVATGSKAGAMVNHELIAQGL